VFENRVLRGIFGPKGKEVRGRWRKLRNDGLRDFVLFNNIITVTKSRRMGWAGNAARVGNTRNAYKILLRYPEALSPLGRSRIR
jgi:hypothetical protein